MRRTKDFDKNPIETLSDFINYTTVQKMIDGQAKPVWEQIPALKRELASCQGNVSAMTGKVKLLTDEVNLFRDKVRDLATFHIELEKVKNK